MTLETLNETMAAKRKARGSTSTARYFVAKVGSSHAGRTGDSVHVAWEVTYGTEPGVSVFAPCSKGSRRPPRVSELRGLDLASVTCSKCLKWLAGVE